MDIRFIVSLFLTISFHGCCGEGEKGSHEEKAIDVYCHAWQHYTETGDWSDSWDSAGIDYAEEDRSASERVDEESLSPSNIYDTYNAAECRRVRKSWNSMSTPERSLYVEGLLELRKQGQKMMELDEFVAIASVHDDFFGSITHHDSDYLFWHGYLVWELESRIRDLGGKFRCFGMPYWDFTDLSVDIYDTGLGGVGEVDDYNRVNGYSWDVTTLQFWTPDHNFVCSAKGDSCPICSIKRDPALCERLNLRNPDYYGIILEFSPLFYFVNYSLETNH